MDSSSFGQKIAEFNELFDENSNLPKKKPQTVKRTCTRTRSRSRTMSVSTMIAPAKTKKFQFKPTASTTFLPKAASVATTAVTSAASTSASYGRAVASNPAVNKRKSDEFGDDIWDDEIEDDIFIEASQMAENTFAKVESKVQTGEYPLPKLISGFDFRMATSAWKLTPPR